MHLPYRTLLARLGACWNARYLEEASGLSVNLSRGNSQIPMASSYLGAVEGSLAFRFGLNSL